MRLPEEPYAVASGESVQIKRPKVFRNPIRPGRLYFHFVLCKSRSNEMVEIRIVNYRSSTSIHSTKLINERFYLLPFNFEST